MLCLYTHAQSFDRCVHESIIFLLGSNVKLNTKLREGHILSNDKNRILLA